MKLAVGVDTGGTFTDVALMDQDDGRVWVAKAFTTSDEPGEGVLEGLRLAAEAADLELASLLAQVDKFVYGSTFATNVIVQRARDGLTGLITTAGFRDTLPMRRMMRRSTFDIQEPYPSPFVPRRLIREVRERLDYEGIEMVPLVDAEVLAAARELLSQGVEAVALCFLHAYANPEHERRAVAVLRQHFPQLYVSASSEVVPEIREYERTSTTVLNAYVGPAVALHVNRLQARLSQAGLGAPLLVMQSNGGVMGVGEAAVRPVNLLFSGPAGGVIAARFLGAPLQADNLITMDMGGTSFDVGLVRGGEGLMTTTGEVEGWALLNRRIDIHSIGAGGGSLASVDPNGVIKVGPESAGSNPGPACYARGGTRPTVTDADVVLGYIHPEHFVGGRIPLDAERAHAAIRAHISDVNGMDVVEAAAGVYQIINARMMNAIRMVTVEKGRDPREFSGIAFGGAGPVHCLAIHRDLGTRQLIVPAAATALSAFGLLATNLVHGYSRTLKARLDELDLERANHLLEEMMSAALDVLQSEGIERERTMIRASADLCYLGQFHELNVPLGSPRLTREITERTLQDFAARYSELYGYIEEGVPVQLVTLRLDGLGLVPAPRLRPQKSGGRDPGRARQGVRPAYFADERAFVPTAIYEGPSLAPDNELEGPAIVEYPGTNVVVGPGQNARCDEWLNLIVV